MTTAEARERVARGATLLDAKRPGWADKIDITRLRMSSKCTCILGQLEGTFWSAAQRLFGTDDTVKLPTIEATECGLWVPMTINGCDYVGYTDLESAWVDAINERLAPQVSWTHREPQAIGVARGVGVVEG